MKVIVSDLDGTLLNHEVRVTENTHEILQMLRKQGYKIGVATGRPLFSAKASVPHLEEEFDFAVTNNGGNVYDFAKKTEHEQYPLSGELVLEIIERFRPLGANPILYLDGKMVTEREDHYNKKIRNMLDMEFVDDMKKQVRESHAKIIFSATPEVVEKMQAYNASHPDSRYNMFKSQTELVEFVDPRVNKEVGIEYYCQEYGIELSEVMAFGDNDNDYEMVKAAGVGVAVKNATDKVKSVADYITESNQDEGVYRFLLDYFTE